MLGTASMSEESSYMESSDQITPWDESSSSSSNVYLAEYNIESYGNVIYVKICLVQVVDLILSLCFCFFNLLTLLL